MGFSDEGKAFRNPPPPALVNAGSATMAVKHAATAAS